MHKIFKIFTLILSMVFITTVFCYSQEKSKEDKEIWISNEKKDDIKIEVVDVKVIKEEIDINEKYIASAIITMNVTNYGLGDIELSNIDIIPHQGNKQTKYFVSTLEENVCGFVGNLRSNESEIVKIGIALHNVDESIRLDINNITDEYNEKTIQFIDIK